jgi:hypothetical protein
MAEEFTGDEITKLSRHFEERDQNEAGSIVANEIAQREKEIDRLEAARSTDYDAFMRSGGSDRLLELLRSE